MIDAQNVPAVSPDEMLARYILHSSHIRRSNQTVKPDAFIPHPYTDLSVTRHRAATEAELWAAGAAVATETQKTLYGRADVRASVALGQRLTVTAKPIPANPNHADISGWAADKPAQKIMAQELAAVAMFVEVPDESREQK